MVTGTKTERELELEAELANERKVRTETEAQKKDRENRINQLEDELRRLTTPAKPKNEKGFMEDFMGWD